MQPMWTAFFIVGFVLEHHLKSKHKWTVYLIFNRDQNGLKLRKSAKNKILYISLNFIFIYKLHVCVARWAVDEYRVFKYV